MDKANNIENLVKEIADLVGAGESVRYDLESLEYGQINQMSLDVYGTYIEMDELPGNIGEKLKDWEIEEVKYQRWVLELPDKIDAPKTREQFNWMIEFAERQGAGNSFIDAVDNAIHSRHPFRAYKDVMHDYGLIDDWYEYRDECVRAYVRHELGLGRSLKVDIHEIDCI